MTIEKSKNGSELTLSLNGRLDTTTAPQLDDLLKEEYNEAFEKLIFDFAELNYISSAGLRVLLAAQKKINADKNEMIIRNANASIMEVFDITGFTDILTIE